MKKALYYKTLDNYLVKCSLCPHNCKLQNNKTGLCRVRQNKDGILYSLNYGKCSSAAMDPIEKKPLHHFYPGSRILSLGTVGCNMACKFCQNWQIAQNDSCQTSEISPEHVLKLVCRENSLGAAYTYNEPAIWYEFVLDTSKIIKEAGYKNVLVTNGYIEKEPLERLLPYIDALNIDVKSMNNEFYKEYCGVTLTPVLEAAVLAKKHAHVEITNLIIPTLNDKDEDFQSLALWVKENLGKDTPVHISRYFPCYKLKIEATSIETLKRAETILKEQLDFVYVGNVSGFDENTYCSECKQRIVKRDRYIVTDVLVYNGRCKCCGAKINIVV